MADVEKVLRLYEELKERKGQVDTHFQDIASVLLPRRQGFASGSDPDGNRLYDEIFDSTPQQAARGLASAIGTMTRPDGQKWFFLRAEDEALNEADEARMWFDEVESLMVSRAFENPTSRFRQALAEADLDLVTFGTAAVFIGERTDLMGMLYESLHLKDVFIVTDENNNINGLIRRHYLNPRQAYGFFGNNVAKTVKDAEADKKSQKKIEHIHVVMPREEKGVGGFSTRLPYSSLWIEVEGKEKLTEGGFNEFPFAVPRFDTTSGEDWGRGPGMIALPDANMLQAMDETIIISGQKRVEPPILVPDDGSFNAANTFPGGLTYYDAELAREMGQMPVAPLDTGADIAIGLEMQQDRRQQVQMAFFKHVLNLPVDGPEMTATEVMKRDQEFLRELGGLFGRLESDYMVPIVERTFNVMLRAGAFPEIPEVLSGQDVQFEYESPLKKVRQQVEAAAARNWKDDLLMLAGSGKPEVLDLLDADEYAKFQAEANSVPLQLMHDGETIKQIREARQQAELQQQQMAELLEGGEAMGKVMKDMSAATPTS